MPIPTNVPLSSWRSYLTAEDVLLPHCYKANSYDELVRFLLEGRCDSSQVSTVLHLCELLRRLRDFQPTLMRIYGDIVRFPRQVVRGRTLVLVEGGLEKAIIAEAGFHHSDIHIRRSSLRKQFASLKRLIARQSRIVPEALDKESPMAKHLLEKYSSLEASPFIDVNRPNGSALMAALENTINEYFSDNDS